MGNLIAELLLKAAVDSAKAYFVQTAQAEIKKSTLEQIRKHMLSVVAQEYTREIAYNATQYVKAVGSASLTVDIEDGASEELEKRLQKSLDEFSDWVGSQPRNSPVVDALSRKYGVQQRSYVGRKPQRPYETAKLGPGRPSVYQNRESKRADVSKYINDAARRIFEDIIGSKDVSRNTSHL